MSSLETEFQLPTQLLDPTFRPCAAVQRCCNAWSESLKDNPHKDHPFGRALEDAQAAYRRAMPLLIGYDNIRDFIACVAQGMLLGAISDTQSSRLLYAAQVAQGALRSPSSRKASA